MDYSIRVPATEKRLAILKQNSKSEKQLSKIKDYLFKPKGVELADFNPDKVCIRLREFLGGERPSTLVKIETIHTESGYQDTKESLREEELETFEKWGEIATVSVEYDLGFAQVLYQDLQPVGKFLKIESETQEGLQKALLLMKVGKNEEIKKNAAVLLGEKLGLI